MPSIEFLVELITTPVLDDDWSRYEAVQENTSYGAIFTQDELEPTIRLIIDAQSDYEAILLARAALAVEGIRHTKICVTQTEWEDMDYDDYDEFEAPTSTIVSSSPPDTNLGE